MMSRRGTFKQADLTRALKAAGAAGLKPSGVRIDSAGNIEVTFVDVQSNRRNGFDAALGL